MKSLAFLLNACVHALFVGLKLSAKEYRILSGSVRSEACVNLKFSLQEDGTSEGGQGWQGWQGSHSREKPPMYSS